MYITENEKEASQIMSYGNRVGDTGLS